MSPVLFCSLESVNSQPLQLMAFIPVADRLCTGPLNDGFYPRREQKLAEVLRAVND